MAEQRVEIAQAEATAMRSEADQKERNAKDVQQAWYRQHDRVFRQGLAIFEEGVS